MNIAPLPISSETGWEYGYLNSSGAISTSVSENDMTSPFLPVFSGREYTITPAYTLPSQYGGWLAVVEYDANYGMIGSRKTTTSGSETIPTTTITPSANAKYIRVGSSNLYNDSAASMSVDYQVTWEMEGDYPVPIQSLQATTDGFVKPYPASLWRIDESNGGYPYNELMPDILYYEPAQTLGAFQGVASLAAVRIPITVKAIGSAAFAGTALQRVKIAADCAYKETSFPAGCVVEHYDDDRYEQLRDCEGRAILDCDARRIYVRKAENANG